MASHAYRSVRQDRAGTDEGETQRGSALRETEAEGGQGMTKPKSGLSRYPRHPKKVSQGEAWWYEEHNSIHVFASSQSTGTLINFHIARAQLADWVKRTERKPK